MADVSGFKLDYAGVGELLRSPEVMATLKSKGDSIASSLNSEGRGEFRAFQGNNAKRARVFVDAYDRYAKRVVNLDPGMMQRHMG